MAAHMVGRLVTYKKIEQMSKYIENNGVRFVTIGEGSNKYRKVKEKRK